MTGKELILYILQNDLENEPVFHDGNFVGFISADKVAEEMNVGTATVVALLNQAHIDYYTFEGNYYIPINFKIKNGGYKIE